MVEIGYVVNNAQWPVWQLTTLLHRLPAPMAEQARRFHQWADSQAYIIGRLLLEQMLSVPLPLMELRFSPYGRPYLLQQKDFNISHTAGMVVCARCSKGLIGIDIEKIKPVEVREYQMVFSATEWADISNSVDMLHAFYTYWTKKEAVLKANGSGFSLPPRKLQVQGNKCYIEDEVWLLRPVSVCSDYSCHIALSADQLVMTPRDYTKIICS